MDFQGINYTAVIVAAAAAFFIGWPWYATFARPWARAVGKDPDNPPKPKPLPFIILAVSLFIMAWVLAGILGHLGKGQVTYPNGLISGLFVWAGLVVPTMVVNYIFQGRSVKLMAIDGGHWFIVLVAMGGIIGWFGL